MRRSPRFRLHPLDAVMWIGLATAALGIAWAAWPVGGVDASYYPFLGSRQSWRARYGPRVLIDEGHWNVDTAGGRYQPFRRLLDADGYRVLSNKEKFVPGLFEDIRVLVIANALGFRGTLQHLANMSGFEGRVDLVQDAFEQEEVEEVRRWVYSGGSLLLIADHSPCGRAARSLAAAFGVGMSDWRVEDPGPTIRFEAGHGLGSHPILEGRPDWDEAIRTVFTYTGQSLTVPEGAWPLLVFSPDAREYPPRNSMRAESRPAAGKAQAVALEYGQGRVVVFGEASALTAQSNGRVRLGINNRAIGNAQLVLNTLHWLTHLL